MRLLDKFKRSSSPSHLLALDIGTEFVKALVVKVEENRGYVIGVGRQRQRLGDMQSGAVTDIDGVIINSRAAIERAEEMAGLRADQAVLGIAGELVKGATTTLHYEREHPEQKIDLGELQRIISQVQWQAFDEARAQLARETGFSELDVRLVNAAIVAVSIDGYRVMTPLGFQGKDVQVSVFNAFAPLVHLGALQTIATSLGLDLLTVTAEPYAVARSVSETDGPEYSGIFIDIGGGTTDIAVVRSGGLEGTRMFALGGRSFTKRLAQAQNLSFTDAEELKLSYAEGLLDEERAEEVRAALEPDCEVWLSGVELALSEFPSAELLPSRILLCGGGSALPEIRTVLLKKDWTATLPFARDPEVSYIRPTDVSGILDETGLLTGHQDITPMALASVGLELIHEDRELLSGIMRRVVRAMQV